MALHEGEAVGQLEQAVLIGISAGIIQPDREPTRPAQAISAENLLPPWSRIVTDRDILKKRGSVATHIEVGRPDPGGLSRRTSGVCAFLLRLLDLALSPF